MELGGVPAIWLSAVGNRPCGCGGTTQGGKYVQGSLIV